MCRKAGCRNCHPYEHRLVLDLYSLDGFLRSGLIDGGDSKNRVADVKRFVRQQGLLWRGYHRHLIGREYADDTFHR